MLRPAGRALVLVAAALALGSVQAMAANPSPPPGSVQVQPITGSAGSATVSTGQSWAGSNAQDTTAAHCGVDASTGSTSYAAQPQQVDTSGASSPNCSAASGNGGQSVAGQTPQGRTASSGNSIGSGSTGGAVTGTGSSAYALKPAASATGLAGFVAWFGWLFLLLLLATLFVLLGVAIGRRRREPVAA
jgi:cobalamin biosynthesis Mg chelatase CobN